MTGDSDAKSVALIVVTFNSRKVLPTFLDAIPDAIIDVDDFKLVIVDNNSEDGTAEYANSQTIVHQVIGLGQNIGYAAGLNAGMSANPDCDAYFALNPDVRLGPGSVKILLDALRLPTGMAVPRLNNEFGDLLYSLRREPSVLREIGESLLGGARAGRCPLFGLTISDPAEYERRTTATWATGGALLISNACATAVGPWDETFFLYEEEVDFCLRAMDQGFELSYIPAASATREIGPGFSPALRALARVNRLRLYERRHGKIPASLLRFIMIIGELLRLAPHPSRSRSALRALRAGPEIRSQPHRVLAVANGIDDSVRSP